MICTRNLFLCYMFIYLSKNRVRSEIKLLYFRMVTDACYMNEKNKTRLKDAKFERKSASGSGNAFRSDSLYLIIVRTKQFSLLKSHYISDKELTVDFVKQPNTIG